MGPYKNKAKKTVKIRKQLITLKVLAVVLLTGLPLTFDKFSPGFLKYLFLGLFLVT